MHLFLSPHMDDVVGSCGCLISQLREQRRPVHIVCLFAGHASPPYSAFARELHALWQTRGDVVETRRQEERMAAACLDATVHFIDVHEAIYRQCDDATWLYDSGEAIFGSVSPHDASLMDPLVHTTRELTTTSTRVYAPAAFGHHVDHVIGFEVGRRLLSDGYDVVFYEDFPYAANERERELRRPALAELDRMQRRFEPGHVERKIVAYRSYVSQIPMLFGDDATMAEQLRAFNDADARGGHESYWMPRLASREVAP